MIITKEGVYKDVTIDLYHDSDGISASGIKLLLDAPEKFHHSYICRKKQNKSPAMVLGNALHAYILEPEKFINSYYIYDNIDKRTKAGKEKYKEAEMSAEGKILLSQDDFSKIFEMSYSARNIIKSSIKSRGNIETSIAFKYDNVLLRSRPDYFDDDQIIDIKTTRDASPDSFSRSVFSYGYHIQAAIAIMAINKTLGMSYNKVKLIAIESTEPFVTRVYRLNQDSIAQGWAECVKAINIYKNSLMSGNWTFEHELDIEVPKYLIESNL